MVLVACADVGSVAQGNFGWAASDGSEGELPSELALWVAASIGAGHSVALGFECPLFVPLPDAEHDLGKAREGEGARPWSAGAGSGALATGLAQVPWVLARARSLLKTPSSGYLDWAQFSASQRASLLVWEAFVTGSAKGASHIDDARRAVVAFVGALPNPTGASAIRAMSQVQSLAGAALLRAGWSTDVTLLAQSCIVMRAASAAA